MSADVEPELMTATATPASGPSRNHGARRRAAKAAARIARLGIARSERELVVQFGRRVRKAQAMDMAKYGPRA